MKISTILKSTLALSLMIITQMSIATVPTTCPTAAAAQVLIADAAASLSTPTLVNGFQFYQGTTSDTGKLDYYTKVAPANILEQVRNLATALVAPQNVTVGSTLYCYYAGSLDATGAPVASSSQVLAIQYGTSASQVYGYYTNWSVYARNFFPNEVSYDTLSTVFYAFEQVGPCGSHNGIPSHDCPVGTGFSGVQDNLLHSTDTWADYQKPMPDGTVGAMPDVIKLAHAASKKVILSIGGYSLSDQLTDLFNDTAISGCTDNGAPIPASSAAARTGFINSMWTGPDPILTNYQFDGVDVDFEPNGNHWGTTSLPSGACYQPVSAQIIQNYAQFLVDLKAALTAHQPGRDILTIALTASPTDIAYIASVNCDDGSGGTISCLKRIANTVDNINVMAYDYHGAFDLPSPPGVTNFSAALYADQAEPGSVPNQGIFNINSTIKAYLAEGISPSKLILGIPAYVRLESGVTETGGPVSEAPWLYNVFTGAPNGEYGDTTGVYDYKCAMAFFAGKFGIQPFPTAYCNASSFAPDFASNVYLRNNSSNQLVGLAAYSPTMKTFFSFDGVGDPSINTLTPKINYVIAQGLGGVMFWDLSGDLNSTDYPLAQYQQYSLIYNANKQLNPSVSSKK